MAWARVAASVFARSSAVGGACCANARVDQAHVAAHTRMTREFHIRSLRSAVLRAGRDHSSVRQFQLANEAGLGSVAGATGLDGDLFPQRLLEVFPGELTGAKEDGRRPFERPGLGLALLVFRVDRQVDMRVPPVDFRQCTGFREPLVEVEHRGHVVVCRRGGGKYDGEPQGKRDPCHSDCLPTCRSTVADESGFRGSPTAGRMLSIRDGATKCLTASGSLASCPIASTWRIRQTRRSTRWSTSEHWTSKPRRAVWRRSSRTPSRYRTSCVRSDVPT